jgi:hypothetical protein
VTLFPYAMQILSDGCYADFQNTDFQNADFQKADFQNANFQNADFQMLKTDRDDFFDPIITLQGLGAHRRCKVRLG